MAQVLRQSTLTDQNNRPISGANVYVYDSTGASASLTSDGTTTLSQPVITDNFGNYQYYANAGVYSEDIFLGTHRIWKQVTSVGSSTDSSLVGFTQSGTGAVQRTVQAKLQEFVSVKDFGAKGDGITNEVSAFQAADAAGSYVVVPPGTYLLNTTPSLTKPLFVLPGATLTGAGAAATGYTTSTTRQNIIPLTAPDQFASNYLRRIANHTGGTAGVTSAGLRVDSYVSSGVTNYEWAGIFMCDNSATAGQNVAIYAQGKKRIGAGPTWALTSELVDYQTNPTNSAVGHEVDITANGTDSNNARVGLDMVVRKLNGAGANAVAGWGYRLNNNGSDSFNIGFGSYAGTTVNVCFDASQANALIGAFKMSVNQPIIFASDNSRQLYHNGSVLSFKVSGVDKWWLTDTGALALNGNQVVGSRITGWGTSTGGSRGSIAAGSATLAQVAAALAQLLEDLKVHGLLGA